MNDIRMSTARAAAVAAAFAVMTACGGSSTSPSGSGGGGGGSVVVGSTGAVATSGATITIANGSVSPAQVTVAVGQSVTFVNNDTRAHDISSDPHPSHTACPSINNANNLQAGQTKLTFGFSGTGSCGFHDHNDPNNNSLKGRIVIQ